MPPSPRLGHISIRTASRLLRRRIRLPPPPRLSTQHTFTQPRIAAATRACTAVRFVTSSATMASDDAYAAFLEKANAIPGAGLATSSSTAPPAATKDHQQDVPPVLMMAAEGQFYTSDADEPFTAVAVPLVGGLPTEVGFIEATGLSISPSDISILDPIDWDRRGQYKGLLDAVREAGEGNDVRVYRVQLDATRVEYWLVTTTNVGQLAGFKAKAVES